MPRTARQRIFSFAEGRMEFEIFEAILAAIRKSDLGALVIADRAGINHWTIYSWLNGRTKNPTIRTLTLVASALGFSIELSGGAARLVLLRQPAAPPPQHGLSPHKMRMLLRSMQ
jgi:DNA-binding phage protein